MNQPTTPRVAIIDDEPGVRKMLAVALQLEGFEVQSAADGADGLSLVRAWQPECIVLDIMMPKFDGLALLPMIRRITEVPIIMLTARGDVRDRIEGIRAGADDYLAKPFDVGELTVRLHAALRRPNLRDVRHLTYEDLSIDLDTRMVRCGETLITLTAREFDLLAVLARRPQRVYTRDQLIRLVWGDDSYTANATVDTYVSYVRGKVDRYTRRPLIATVRGVGYSLR